MYVSMYIYINVCMHVCNVDGCNHLRPSAFLFVCIHYINLEHACMHIYCLFVCMYVCMYVCMCQPGQQLSGFHHGSSL